jgi:diacylglycerol kinase (ATP)
MTDPLTQPPEAPDAQKQRKGLARILHAGGYSLEGLKAGWSETAFRQELLLSLVMIPAAFWLGQTWVETVLLVGTVIVVLITELLNTAIETAIDRIGGEWHVLSKKAKDLGSAAVLLSLLLCGGTWLAAVLNRWG